LVAYAHKRKDVHIPGSYSTCTHSCFYAKFKIWHHCFRLTRIQSKNCVAERSVQHICICVCSLIVWVDTSFQHGKTFKGSINCHYSWMTLYFNTTRIIMRNMFKLLYINFFTNFPNLIPCFNLNMKIFYIIRN